MNAVILITVMALTTAALRFLPFLVFTKKTPSFVVYPGKVLPAALIGMLVVYCLRSVDLMSGSHGLPELIAVLVTAGVHLWRRQTLLSIVAGTACYMILLQFVFA